MAEKKKIQITPLEAEALEWLRFSRNVNKAVGRIKAHRGTANPNTLYRAFNPDNFDTLTRERVRQIVVGFYTEEGGIKKPDANEVAPGMVTTM